MGLCLACGKSGLFMKINGDGICSVCQSQLGQMSYSAILHLIKKYTSTEDDYLYVQNLRYTPIGSGHMSIPELKDRLNFLAMRVKYSLIPHRTWIRDAVNPDVYFQHYHDFFIDVDKAIEISRFYRYDFSPSEMKQEYIKKQDIYTMAFLDRWWDSVLNNACNMKTLSVRERQINEEIIRFRENWYGYLSDNFKLHFDNLASMIIDIEGMEKKLKLAPVFDIVGEAVLLNELKSADNVTRLHLAYSNLLEFYYKYRNTDGKYLDMCIEYCKKDMGILPALDVEAKNQAKNDRDRCASLGLQISDGNEYLYDRTEKYGFIGNIPAFKRLCIIYEKKCDYHQAIECCDLAIRHYYTHDLKTYAEEFEKRKTKLEKKN